MDGKITSPDNPESAAAPVGVEYPLGDSTRLTYNRRVCCLLSGRNERLRADGTSEVKPSIV